MASLTQWTWVCVDSESWWWTGRPGVLWFMGSQRIGHDWAAELNHFSRFHIYPFIYKFVFLFLTYSVWQSLSPSTSLQMTSVYHLFFPVTMLTPLILWCFPFLVLVFPGGSEVKASASNAGDPGSIPELGRSSGEGNGNWLQYSCLKNPMDGGALVGYSPQGLKVSNMTKRLHFTTST